MRSANQIIGLIKAQQHAFEKRVHGCIARQQEGPKDFPHWFLAGLHRIEERGASFELLEPERNNGIRAVRIDWGTHDLIRSMDDFLNEYKTEYLPKFRRVAA